MVNGEFIPNFSAALLHVNSTEVTSDVVLQSTYELIEHCKQTGVLLTVIIIITVKRGNIFIFLNYCFS